MKKRVNKYIQFFLVGALIFLFACQKQELADDIAIGEVTRGTLFLELYEEGEVEAVNSTVISAPNVSWRFGNLKISSMVKDGKEVKEGELLIEFDPSEVQKGITDAESRLEMNLAELEKMEAQHASDLEDLRSDYEVTRISQEISKIRFESSVFEAEIKRKEIQLNLEKANIALERAKEQIDNRIKIQKEEIRQKKLSIEQDRTRLREAHETMDKFKLYSPSSGIAIITENWTTGNKFQVGDQSWSGAPLILLPDLSKLRATIKINEVDIAKVEKGLRVEIKPDAFSDSIYSGVVKYVANLAVNKEQSSKIKVFPVEIAINETSENLLPGLTVSCRIIVGEINDVLMVPLDAIFSEGSSNYVYKKTGKSFEKILVETSSSNSDYIIITKGLKEKDKVALTLPFEEDEAKESSSEANE